MTIKNRTVCHVITGLNDGGAEAVLYRLCSMDQSVRHLVVSLMDGGKYGPLLEASGVSVVCLGMPQGRLTLAGLWQLWRFFRRERPDAIQTWMYHGDLVGGVVARLTGMRQIFWGIRNSILASGKSRRSTIIIARLNAWLSSCIPKKIICCAERAREVHRELGYESDKMVVIPNGYDLSHFSPDVSAGNRLRAEWGITEGTAVLGMVGRFDPFKDHQNLLAALARLKSKGRMPFHCVLVGRGMDRDNVQLDAWLREYGLQSDVSLLGQRNDVPAVMSALNIHVLSSSSEAFPNVLAEAMACGTPCVTTDVGDAGVIVGETGWVIPPANADKLAEALASALEMYRDAPEWQIRCDLARKRVEENFSLERMIDAYHAVWLS